MTLRLEDGPFVWENAAVAGECVVLPPRAFTDGLEGISGPLDPLSTGAGFPVAGAALAVGPALPAWGPSADASAGAPGDAITDGSTGVADVPLPVGADPVPGDPVTVGVSVAPDGALAGAVGVVPGDPVADGAAAVPDEPVPVGVGAAPTDPIAVAPDVVPVDPGVDGRAPVPVEPVAGGVGAAPDDPVVVVVGVGVDPGADDPVVQGAAVVPDEPLTVGVGAGAEAPVTHGAGVGAEVPLSDDVGWVGSEPTTGAPACPAPSAAALEIASAKALADDVPPRIATRANSRATARAARDREGRWSELIGMEPMGLSSPRPDDRPYRRI